MPKKKSNLGYHPVWSAIERSERNVNKKKYEESKKEMSKKMTICKGCKEISSSIFNSPDGMVHFISNSGIHTKANPADVKLYYNGKNKIYVYNDDDIQLGSFFK